MDAVLLKSIEGKKKELDRFRPLPPSLVRRLEEEFSLEWTYNTNAIEGNTLSLRETALVINRGVTIGGKSLREHFEALNHAEAIQRIYEFCRKKSAFSEALIVKLHSLILKNIDEENAGSYRYHNVRIMGALHIPPDARKIKALMDAFIRWYYENEKKLPIAELAAQTHYRLVHIHPFMDGNGRTARLIMNFILIRNGYPPAVIMNLDRKKYYRVLMMADSGKTEVFENFIGRSIERSLVIYLNTIIPPGKKSKERQGYISLQEATRYCDYSQEYLSFLARSGRLPSIKFNRNWMTTIEAVKEYAREQAQRSEKTRSTS